MRVELRARAPLDLAYAPRRARAGRGRGARRHRVEHLGDEDDARAERDVLAGEAVRIPRAVPALVVVQHPVGDRIDAEALEHAVADLRVPLNDEPLGVRQRAGLAQDLLGDRELAEVVQAAGEPRQLDLARPRARAARRSRRRSRPRAPNGCPCRRRGRRPRGRARPQPGSARAGRRSPATASSSASSTEPASRTWFLPCSFAQ